MSFLPEKYEVPSSADKYYKFKTGENRFRIMSSPILGYVYWVDENNSRKPIRYRMQDKGPDTALVPDDTLKKHFWAMVVYDYEVDKLKILEITQKGIQKTLTGLAKDADWGSPVGDKGYDIVITKTGEDLNTEYQVTPKPKKKLPDGVEAKMKEANIRLEALYDGEDPFASNNLDTGLEDITVPDGLV